MSGRTPLQLGEPPPWLDDRPLPIITSTGALLFQCHKQARGPLSFNPTPLGRFNAPAGEYGTTYLSTSAEGAFVETLVQDAPRGQSGSLAITRSRLLASCLCQISPGVGARPLRLVDLTGNGVIQIGATAELCALADIARLALVQRWALRLYQHQDQPDGIMYRARHDPSRVSIALFDRAHDLLVTNCGTNLLTDGQQLGRILDHYGVGLFG